MKVAIYAGALALVVLLVAGSDSAQADTGGWYSCPENPPIAYCYSAVDFNNDCVINMLDIQAIAVRYGAFFGNPLYDTRYDTQPWSRTGSYDYDIDIKDLQKVFGRDSLSCLMFWDIETSMGEYSYKGSSSCSGTANYKDPITVVFTGNATSDRLEQEAPTHGFPVLEYDGEQRFWEIGECSYEDVDAAENKGGCHPGSWPPCPEPDSWERWHFRAEVGAEGYGHINWGTFAVATPHFDDDDESCNVGGLIPGHFVPQVFPYPEMIYPGFTGSGFDAGREYIAQQFGGSYNFEYWGNTRAIPQPCGDNQWPASEGWVYYIPID